MSKIISSPDQNISLEISDDSYNAYLCIKNNLEFINEKDIIDLIEQSGIVFGIDEAVSFMQDNDIKKQLDVAFPLACGQKPKEPELEFSPLFNPNQCYHSTIGNQFYLLPNLVKVKKGEPLAHLFVTKPSKSGINIFGEEVNPESSEHNVINNYLGENVEYSMDRGQIVALKSGYPWIDELSRIHVQSDFVIENDLDMTYDNFKLFGNLTVNGNICEKAQIYIDGDLTVQGNIEDASVNVTGDIVVNGDINSCKHTGIIADGNISFQNAENSRIACGGKISFSKNAHFCRLMAEKGVYGDEENSSLVGGIIQSGEHIEASVIGSSSMINTETEISISPFTKEKMLLLTKQIMKMREQGLTDSEEFTMLSESIQELETKLENEINKTLKNEDQIPKHIMIFKRIYPGVYIRILKKSINVSEEMSTLSYSIVDGELVSETY
jgi:uncharacterized protein (DUF342 family)